MNSKNYDIAIVGGGIVGLATGYRLTRLQPGLRIVLIEKEDGPAKHQTGRNSGVMHSGIYYSPGSLKAQFAKQGSASMAQFCHKYGIAYDVCGKVIVAVEEKELPRLDALYARGQENGIEVRKLTAEQLREREPHVSGLAALLVPSAGIADYSGVCRKLAELICEAGGNIQYNCNYLSSSIKGNVLEIVTSTDTIEASNLISCAGLFSDRVSKKGGAETKLQVVPFRGEYYCLKPESRHLINHLVYPLPNPEFPFLGVHFTRMVNSEIHAGPNAVLALKREGYSNMDFSVYDTLQMLGYSGFRKMAAKHWREGMQEMKRSFSRKAFLIALQRLVPQITANDIVRSPAGVRAMTVQPDGTMVDDFLIVPGPRSLHVLNAPSPAATASLEIGTYVAEKALRSFGFG